MKQDRFMDHYPRFARQGHKTRVFTGAVMAVWLFAGAPLWAGVGLVTRFADVILENVKVGQLYNLREVKSMPYTITNLSSLPINVTVEVKAPATGEVLEGYEAIPDPTWVKAIPQELSIGGNGSAFAELLLQVPDDPKYAGRHFQVILWAHTKDDGFVGVGVKSRLRFSTGAGPETLKEEKRRRAMLTLNFDMSPQSMYLSDVESGPYDVKEMQDKSIKIINRAETAVGFTVKSVPWDGRFVPEPGYEPAPDPSWLKVDPEELEVDGLQIKVVKLALDVPDDKRHRGKRYAFLVKAQTRLGAEVETFTRVFVSMKDK